MAVVREIDLGVDRAAPVLHRPPGWWWHRLRRGWGAGRRHRRWALLPVLLALLPTPAATAAPADSPLVVVALRDPPAEEPYVVGDLLFIAESRPAPGVMPTWSAHRLPDGAYLWTVPDRPWAATADGSLVTSTPAGTAVHHPSDGSVRFRTERALRLVPGTALGLVLDGPVLPTQPDDTGVWRIAYRSVELVDLTQGQVHWSAQLEQPAHAVLGGPGGVVTATERGATQRRELSTGRLTAEAALGMPIAPGRARVTGDTVIGYVGDPQGPHRLRAHDLRTLTPRWSRPVTAEELSYQQDVFAWFDGDRWHVLADEHTGAVVTIPSRREARLWVWDGRALLVDRSGRLLGLYDATTGEPISAPTGWRLVQPAAADPRRVLLTHPFADGSTGLAWLDLTTGERSYVGRDPATLTGCTSFDGGLLCDADGRLALLRWR